MGEQKFRVPTFYKPERLAEIAKRSPYSLYRRKAALRLRELDAELESHGWASKNLLKKESEEAPISRLGYREMVTRRLEDVLLFGKFGDIKHGITNYFRALFTPRSIRALRRATIDADDERIMFDGLENLLFGYDHVLGRKEFLQHVYDWEKIKTAALTPRTDNLVVEFYRNDILMEIGRVARHGTNSLIRNGAIMALFQRGDIEGVATVIMRGEYEDARMYAAHLLVSNYIKTSDVNFKDDLRYWMEYALRRCCAYNPVSCIIDELRTVKDPYVLQLMASTAMYSKTRMIRNLAIVKINNEWDSGQIWDKNDPESAIKYIRFLSNLSSGSIFGEIAIDALALVSKLIFSDSALAERPDLERLLRSAFRPAFKRPCLDIPDYRKKTSDTVNIVMNSKEKMFWKKVKVKALPVIEETLGKKGFDGARFRKFVNWLTRAAIEERENTTKEG